MIRRAVFRAVWWADRWMHRLGWCPRWLCILFDLTCGMTWKEARS
jgi:hypothetical protein